MRLIAALCVAALPAGCATCWVPFNCYSSGKYGFGALERWFSDADEGGEAEDPKVHLKCRTASGAVVTLDAPACPEGMELVGSTRIAPP